MPLFQTPLSRWLPITKLADPFLHPGYRRRSSGMRLILADCLAVFMKYNERFHPFLSNLREIFREALERVCFLMF
jgi:hypothetical protein